jgi:hypothetical protein
MNKDAGSLVENILIINSLLQFFGVAVGQKFNP